MSFIWLECRPRTLIGKKAEARSDFQVKFKPIFLPWSDEDFSELLVVPTKMGESWKPLFCSCWNITTFIDFLH